MYSPPGVEDPISAIFDLSDRVAEMAPTMRRMYRYTATVTAVFLAIMVVLLFVGLASNAFLVILALVAIVFGFLALSLLRETDRFYRSYLDRHRTIRLLQEADPAPKIPEGRTAVQRLSRYLTESNPRVGEFVRRHPDAMRYRVRLGDVAPFDLLLVAPASRGWRWVGSGEPGFGIVARLATEPLTVAQLETFGRELQTVRRHIPARISRIIVLRAPGDPIPDPVHDFAVGNPVDLGYAKVPIEVVGERSDGVYDLVPHVVGVP